MTANIPPIRIATIYRAYYDIGAPEYPYVGHRIQAEMKSGRVAVYECTFSERAFGVDWDWLTYTFHHWLREDEHGKYPAYC